MRSFTINFARAINRASGMIGKVFACRYHTRAVRGARHAHRTVVYVLNNMRKHGLNFSFPVDPYSSGPTFAHWDQPIPPMAAWYASLPMPPPQTRLLSMVRHVDPYEVPSSGRW